MERPSMLFELIAGDKHIEIEFPLRSKYSSGLTIGLPCRNDCPWKPPDVIVIQVDILAFAKLAKRYIFKPFAGQHLMQVHFSQVPHERLVIPE
jgi:hypothetical protein